VVPTGRCSAASGGRSGEWDLPCALAVEVRRCSRNRRRFIVVSATGEVLLRTLSDTMRDHDIAERFASP
jgi:hypothetical protein